MESGGIAAESFRAALKSLVAARGHGAQSGLADALGTHRQVISDILAGRKNASSRTQEKIAAFFGLSLGELLRIGENLLQGRVVFPWADQLEGLPPLKQLLRIVELTNEQTGFPQDNLGFLKDVVKFLEGRITAASVYTAYLKMIRARTK